MLRVLTAGESHGPELIAVMEGLPAGVPVSRSAIQADLARRKLGYGRGSRMKFEEDELTISGGIRFGLTMGSPVALRIGNTEWPRWTEVMSAEPVDPETLPKNAVETHVSLFDGSNCGISLTDRPAFSVQYHPEASPGPQDSHYLFDRFVELMDRKKAQAA